MKKVLALLLLLLMLAGCAEQTVYESVLDVYSVAERKPGEIRMSLPEEASVLTSSADGSRAIYFCDGYTLTVQTLSGGDLERTLRETTGYGENALTLLTTQRNGMRCITCAWSSAGETGDEVGRMLLLDDGQYHYVVTVMAAADKAGELAPEWERIMESITLQNIAA